MRKLIFLFLLVSLFLPLVGLAGTYTTTGGQTVTYTGLVPCGRDVTVDGNPPQFVPCQLCHFFVMVNGIWAWILTYLVTPVAVLMFVIGGIMFVIAAGNPSQVDSSKRVLTGAVMGLALVFGSFLIVNTVLSALGVASVSIGFINPSQWFVVSCPISL